MYFRLFGEHYTKDIEMDKRENKKAVYSCD